MKSKEEKDSIKSPQKNTVRVIKQRVFDYDFHPPEEDLIVIEDPLNITLLRSETNDCTSKPLVMTMRTPGDDKAMIYGFLFSEGIIQDLADVIAIAFRDTDSYSAPTTAEVQLRAGLSVFDSKIERHFAMHSSCGVCGKASADQLALHASLKFDDKLRIDPNSIHTLPNTMRKQQDIFHNTGGLHAAALFDKNGSLLASAEDIGRHNAMDKVIGHGLMKNSIETDACTLCVSGRMSYEILQKALIARIPIIAGVGAPSSLAVSIANDFNITLIGFVRQNSYSIYSAPERLQRSTSP